MKITLMHKTPSINHVFGFKGYMRYIKKEGRELRELITLEIKSTVPKEEIESFKDKKLRVETEIHENWYTKKGEIKTKDVSNREKFLTDSVFHALGLDDKQIFHHIMKKIQSDTEMAVISIDELKDE